jgi:predicted RNA-binding protein associated with RNAse of E/G family
MEMEPGPTATRVTIRKLDHAGRQVTAYPGQVLWRDDRAIVLRTGWNRAPLDLGFVVLEPGDRWTEYFYTDKWYNIFEIRASDGCLKGWYCNVTRPAHISSDEVAADDLALDLWVAPNGKCRVLDEDEFAALPLTPEDREAAQQALAELQAMVGRRATPFDGGDGDG